MRTLGITTAFMLALTLSIANAQNTFFPTKAGLVQVYEHKNDKGKTEGFTQQTIKNVEGSGSNMTISYVAENLDKNRKPLSNPSVEIPYKVIIKDDVMTLDMNQMFTNLPQDTRAAVEITGVPMELPGDLQPGQPLKDANMAMTMDMGIMKMKTEMKMTDGKCLGIEEVTVPAGTFECHKITQTVTTTIMKRPVVTRTVSWYAPGTGVVKTESYDEKDKLQSSTELVENR